MASTKVKDERMDELKRESQVLDAALKNDKDPTPHLEQIESHMHAALDDEFGTPVHLEYFLNEMLPKFVHTLLKRGDLSDELVPKINQFFQSVIELIISFVNSDHGELIETLCRLFTPTMPFYKKYAEDTIDEDYDIYNKKEPKEEEIIVENNDVTAYMLSNVKHFAQQDGFKTILDRIKDNENKVPLVILKFLLKAIVKIRELVNSNFLVSYVEELRVAIFSLILNLTDEELKNEERKTITDITNFLDVLMRMVEPNTSEIIERFNLRVALKCFNSPYLEKRVSGLNDIKEVINGIMRKQEWLKKQHPSADESEIQVPNNFIIQWMTPKFIIDWIKENTIIEQLYGKGMHAELIKRSVDIVKYLAMLNQLDRKYIDMIWDASLGKHESISHIIHVSVAELATHLTLTDIDYLFDKIRKIPYSEYDSNTLMLVRNFSISAINTNIATAKKKKWYGVEIFWEIIQDEVVADPDIQIQALENLFQFLQWPNCHAQRVTYMELCIQNLEKSKSVPQSLKLLVKIINTYPEKPQKKTDSDCIPSVIEWLDSNNKLLSLFFKDLLHYKSAAKEMLASWKGDSSQINNAILVGKQPHLVQIKDRLEFLDYVLGHSSLALTPEQLDIFWACQIMNPLTSDERDLGFAWLENARGTSHAFPAFTDEDTQYLFEQKVPQLDFASLSAGGFSFFEFFFRYVNWKHSKFEQDSNSNYIVLSFDLIGMNLLWKIALEARDPLVGKHAITFLNNLHKNFSAELRPLLGRQREEYIRVCMTHLAQASQDYGNSRNALIVERSLSLLKTFLDEFETKLGVGLQKHGKGAQSRGSPITLKVNIIQGSSFELELFANDPVAVLRQKIGEKINHPPSLLRIITNGRELKDDGETLQAARVVNNQIIYGTKRMKTSEADSQSATPVPRAEVLSHTEVEDESIYPSFILSKQEYFDQLFQLLNLESVAQQVWDLVMLLPTNRKTFSDIFSLQAPNRPNWGALLDTQSTFKLLYSLQIIESLLYNSEDDSDEKRASKAAWRENFLQLGGLNHLILILMSNDFQDKSKGSKRKLCLGLLLKITNSFLLERTQVHEQELVLLKKELLSSAVDPSLLIPKLMEITWHAAIPAPESESKVLPFTTLELRTPEAEDSSVVAQAIALLIAVVASNNELLKSLLNHPSFDSWLSGLALYSLDKQIRERTVSGLFEICKDIQTVIGSMVPHNLFVQKLLAFLPKITPGLSTCEEYFEFLNKLIGRSCDGVAGGKPSDFVDLLRNLVQMIKVHPIVEKRNTKTEDLVLIGLLNLTRTIVSKDVLFKYESGSSHRGGLIFELFEKCLFEIPTAQNHGPLAPPKCKTQKSRKTAFRLLTELARDCLENFEELTGYLLRQHSQDEKRISWHYLPNAFQKSSTGYVGLKNLGATCYMNSLMQQLYMVPPLRYGILSAPVEERLTAEEEGKENQEPKEQKDKKAELLKDNLLYQLQFMFSNLQESERKFYDTREFCKSYKYDGQPVNPSIQMDADEYFNMLFDKIETMLKGTKQENLLKDYFGGTLCNQIISKECEHVSEREERFFTVSLEVKNKKNIVDSLGLYVEGDVLEGDNKYFCSICEKKVDALKRSCLNSLPDTLIVHLKRFEFDLEQLKRVKVNDYCEFPMQLNMEAYTKEGLARKENQNVESDRPPSYYDYELTGILVHTGTADSGHYYSFIREKSAPPGKEKKWFQFNDTDVEPFDTKDIPSNCFGGVDAIMQWDPMQQKHVPRFSSKMYSAYMLFYERIKPVKPESKLVLPPAEESRVVPQNIFNKIWDENMAFLNDKNIFDADYFQFLWSIVSLSVPTTQISYDAPKPTVFDPLMRSIELGTRFLIVTLAHAKEKPNLRDYVNHLKTLYSMHLPACRWLLETLCNDNTWLRQILFLCNIPETRDLLAGLFIHVMSCLILHERPLYNQEDPLPEEMQIDSKAGKKKTKVDENPLIPKRTGVSKSVVIRFMDNLLSMLKEANPHWHNYGQYFLIFREFANFGTPEKAYLLSRQVIAQFIDFYLADDSPYAQHFKQKRPKMGDKFTSPLLGYMIDCVSLLARSSSINMNNPPSQLPGGVLQISEIDKTMLLHEGFFVRSLRENINPKCSADIAVHICWEDEALSVKIMDVCTSGINLVDHDGFRPYFEVFTPLLALQDSIQAKRIEHGMKTYMNVVDNNSKYKNATFHSIKFLVELIPSNPMVSDWLFEHKERWIEHYFLGNWSDSIRDMTGSLILGLIPEYPTLSVPEGQPIRDPSLVNLSTATITKMHDLYRHLLSLFRTAKNYWRVDVETGKSTADYDIAAFKLVSYFRLLKWFARSSVEKAIFKEYYADFISLFMQTEDYHYVCDENKRALLDFWAHICTDCLDNVKIIVSNDKLVSKLFDLFISISPSEKFVRYNQTSLPSFYSILLMCATQSTIFLQKLAQHNNFDWAIKYLYLETAEYALVASVIFEILKLCCNAQQIGQVFRMKHIPTVIQNEKVHVNSLNVLRFLGILLKTTEDSIVFCKHHGLDQLQRFIENRAERDHDERLAVAFEEAFNVFYKATHWLVDDNLPEQFKPIHSLILQSWDPTSRLAIMSPIILILKRYSSRDKLCERCYRVLIDISQLDPLCLNGVLRYLFSHVQQSPYVSNMELQDSTSKPESFYIFAHTICERALSLTETQTLKLAVDLAVLLTREVLLNSALFDGYIALLEKIWDNKELATQLSSSQPLQHLLTHIILVDNQLLSDPKCEGFVRKVLPKLHFPESVAVNTFASKLGALTVSLSKSVEEMDPGFAESTILNILHLAKALTVALSDQGRKEFVKSNKDKFSVILNLLQNEKLKQFDRAQDLQTTLAHIMEL